jgi:hypothetical protein
MQKSSLRRNGSSEQFALDRHSREKRESNVFDFNSLTSLDPRFRGDDGNYSDLPKRAISNSIAQGIFGASDAASATDTIVSDSGSFH